MKVALLGHGCVRERAIETNCLELLDNNPNIEDANTLLDADYIIYVTCAGVGETIKKCLGEIMAINEYKNTDAKLIIVGCLTNVIDIEQLEGLSNAKIIKNRDWIIPVNNYINELNNKNSIKTKLINRTNKFFGKSTSIQFFLEDGCSNRCTFCKTNYNNSKVVSMPYDDTLNYLKNMIKRGTRIITLSGENTTLYGMDLYGEQLLHQLIHDLSKEEDLWKLDIGELTIRNMYKELEEELINNPKIRTVDIQLETASDRLLKMMGRGHTLEEYDYYVKKFAESGKNIETVLMSAFPTETYEDLNITIDYLKKRGIFTNGICEYVDFEFIPSSKFKQLPKLEKRRHTKYLTREIRKINTEIQSKKVGNVDKMIYVGNFDGYYIFENDTECPVLSRSSRFKDLEEGTLVEEKIKRFVYKNSFNGENAFKI